MKDMYEVIMNDTTVDTETLEMVLDDVTDSCTEVADALYEAIEYIECVEYHLDTMYDIVEEAGYSIEDGDELFAEDVWEKINAARDAVEDLKKLAKMVDFRLDR